MTTTAHQDRWELIADRLWKIPELGWAIAEANPDLAGYLVLPAGLPLVIPELRSLRRPLTAANPAREDDGEFQQLPPDTPRPPLPPSSGGGGSVVFPIEIFQGGTGAVSAQQALLNLGAVALSSRGVPGGIAELDGGAIVPLANLPPFPPAVNFPIAISQGGTGGITASAARANIGAIALSDVPASIPPTAIGTTIAPLVSGLVPVGNLPAYPTLGSLGGIPISQRGSPNGIAPLDSNSWVPVGNLPPYPTLASLEGIPNSAIGTTIAPLTSGLVPISNLPPYPTLISLGALAASSRGAVNGVAPLDASLRVPTGNLPPFQSPLTFPIAIAQGGTGGTDPVTARTGIGAMAASDRGAAGGVAPLVSGLVPTGNLPSYPTLGSLGGVSLATNQTITGTKIFTGFTTLGDNVAIKKKFFSGTTSATQGGSTTIAHGITGGVPKIVSITGIITYLAGAFVVMNSPQMGFQVAISGDGTNISVYNIPSPNSVSVLSKPFVLILEYIA